MQFDFQYTDKEVLLQIKSHVMESKKSSEANIEKLRFPVLLTALLFTGSIVLASFTYSVSSERSISGNLDDKFTEIQFMQEVVEPDQPDPIQPEQPVIVPPTQHIIIDTNKTEIEPHTVISIIPPDITIGPDVIIAPPPPVEFPDVEASFEGLQQWIADNVQYPQTSIEMGEQGKVYLSFVVEVDGSISDVNIERGVSTDLNREAQRLMRIMPSWDAGEVAGLKVRTRCRLPINFRLN